MTRDCEFCGSPAQWQFTEVVGGNKHTVHVCSNCARDRGLVGHSPIESEPSFEDAPPQITSISIHVSSQVDPGALPTAPRRCPGCGTSLVEIRKSGRVGCPACYVAFRDHLEPLLRRVHGCVSHTIDEPRAAAPRVQPKPDPEPDPEVELRRLEGRLQRAIAEEDFEAAARIRDRIEAARQRVRRGGAS